MTVLWTSDSPQEIAEAVASGMSAALGTEVGASLDADGTPCLDVPLASWRAAAEHARDVLHMDFFDWLTGVDAPDADEPGVGVVLHVAATGSAGRPRDGESDAGRPPRMRRVLVRTHVPDTGSIPSLTSVWPGAGWHERETFEMFGVVFDGFEDHSDLGLRSLLLPEGFEGTPLRKSFVLAARAVKPWPGAKEPGESEGGGAGRRAKASAPGVPDPSWGPRPATDPAPEQPDTTGTDTTGTAALREGDVR